MDHTYKKVVKKGFDIRKDKEKLNNADIIELLDTGDLSEIEDLCDVEEDESICELPENQQIDGNDQTELLDGLEGVVEDNDDNDVAEECQHDDNDVVEEYQHYDIADNNVTENLEHVDQTALPCSTTLEIVLERTNNDDKETEQDKEPLPCSSGKTKKMLEKKTREPTKKKMAPPKPKKTDIVSTCMTAKEYFNYFLEANGLTKKKEIQWITVDSFETPQLLDPPTQKEPCTIDSLPLPSELFSSYITDDLVEQLVHFTNLYAVQNNVNNFQPTTVDEMTTFIGIHLIMGNLGYPRARMYWEPRFRINLIADNMTLNRFFKLRNNVHVVDTTNKDPSNEDRFWKVRPIFDTIRTKCKKLELENNLSIDEQMVPFKGSLNVKQYVKDKPTKWGIKIFVLCGESGLMYDFVLYQGSTTEIVHDHAMFGLGAGVVMHLSQRITVPYCKLYFDNFFSSYWLFQWLSQRNIYAAGTIREDRFSKPPLESTSDIRKYQNRGHIQEVVSTDGIVLTKWYDNSCVVMGSNFVGSGQVDSCVRWEKEKKEYIEVVRPEAVKLYNASMGGVDKYDFLIAIYRTFIRSKKWTLRLITHSFDLAVTNAWLEYRRAAAVLNVPPREVLDLIHFRQHVGESLILSGKSLLRKRGRPSSSPTPATVHHKRLAVVNPLQEVRYDKVDHLPEVRQEKSQSRCKNIGCKGKTSFFCIKCKIALCINKERNCFLEFHKKD